MKREWELYLICDVFDTNDFRSWFSLEELGKKLSSIYHVIESLFRHVTRTPINKGKLFDLRRKADLTLANPGSVLVSSAVKFLCVLAGSYHLLHGKNAMVLM